MMWEVLTQEEKNKVLLKMMVQVSRADQNLSQKEFAYLIHVCNQLGLDTELIREYSVSSVDLKEILPESEEERMQILYHLLFVMKADEIIQPEEERKLYDLAFRLGFSEPMTRDFIQILKESPIDVIPTSALLDVIRKYLN
ncbi:MAG: TerB family tellurite resistance protein [Saprospiraceae bacterium]|jgi:uncharacterized tellurite resistance protein B-like protein|nr:TerB family tellurite resistance protein [Saprospiraceae bacterium]